MSRPGSQSAWLTFFHTPSLAHLVQVVRRQDRADEAIVLFREWLAILEESGLSMTAGQRLTDPIAAVGHPLAAVQRPSSGAVFVSSANNGQTPQHFTV